MVNIDGNIILFGGIHEITWELNDLYKYNIESNTWKQIEQDSARRSLTKIPIK